MKDIYIIGAGGHGSVVAESAVLLGYTIAGFIDDNPERAGQEVLDWTVLGGCDLIPDGANVALGIGMNAVRARLMKLAEEHSWELPVIAHPSAVISASAVLGAGTVVMAQVAINARANIGRGCILNTGCSVDHDCVLGDFAHIAPGTRLAGTVSIGGGTLIGIGSSVRPNITIGSGSIIGAGSVVVKNIPDDVVVSGNPGIVRKANITKLNENKIGM